MSRANDKGNEAELYVQKHYEAKGYTVHRARASRQKIGLKTITVSHDIWGCFDLLCKKADEIIYIQVACGSKKADKEKKILAVDIWGPQDRIEIWLKMDGGVWKIYRFNGQGFAETAQIRGGKYYELRDAA